MPFAEVAADVGLNFASFIGASGEFYMSEIMGSGCALLDYDADGDLDAYVLQGAPIGKRQSREDYDWPPGEPWPPRNQLYRNDLIKDGTDTGKLTFTDVTDSSGAGDIGYGYGVAVGDYDNDGFVDIYVTNWGPNALYHNNGDGTFTNVTEQAGVADPGWSTSTTFVDYDTDGDLDLFVANYCSFEVSNHMKCYSHTGARDYCSPNAYDPQRDRLYKNNGNGTFSDATLESGIHSAYGNGLGVVTGDFNGDHLIDLYVANDAQANQLWLNQGDGSFVDDSLLGGAAYNESGLPEAGMGVIAGDPDQDGDEDLFVTHLVDETNTFYRNQGDGMFDDSTELNGLGACSRTQTGFGTGWFDYDNDTWLDLFIACGAVKEVQALSGEPFPFHIPNQLLRNLGAGEYRDVSAESGPPFAASETSRGAAFGDVDNDGDVDVFMSNNNAPVRLYLNQVGNRRPWIRLKLEGRSCNRDAIDSLVRIKRSDRPDLMYRVRAGGSYCSSSDLRLTIGLGDNPEFKAVEVHWPGGGIERWTDVPLRETTVLRQGEGPPMAGAES